MPWFPCCCDDECIIFSDGFNRNNGPLGDNWENGSSFEIRTLEAKNVNPLTTLNDDSFTYHAPAEATENRNYVRLTFTFGNPGDRVLAAIVVDPTGASYFAAGMSFFAAEVESSGDECGFLRLYEVNNYAKNQVGESIPVEHLIFDFEHILEVCFDQRTPALASLRAKVTTQKPVFFNDIFTPASTNVVAYGHDVVPPIADRGGFAGFGSDSVFSVESLCIDNFSVQELGDQTDLANPCPHCRLPCVIARDGFDRSILDDPHPLAGCSWDEQSGTWLIEDGILKLSTDGLAINTHTDPRTDTEGREQRVSSQVQGTITNQKLSVVIDYVDDDNYHFAEIELNTHLSGPGLIESGTLRLYSRSGGTNTQLGVEESVTRATLLHLIQLHVCIEYDESGDAIIRATAEPQVFGSFPIGMTRVTTAHGGRRAGIKGADGGVSHFHDFSFEQTVQPGGELTVCGSCGAGNLDSCRACIDGIISSSFAVRIENAIVDEDFPFFGEIPFFNGNEDRVYPPAFTCCTGLNGSHILTPPIPANFPIDNAQLLSPCGIDTEYSCYYTKVFSVDHFLFTVESVFGSQEFDFYSRCSHFIQLGFWWDVFRSRIEIAVSISGSASLFTIPTQPITLPPAAGFYAGFRTVVEPDELNQGIDCLAIEDLPLELVCFPLDVPPAELPTIPWCNLESATVEITAT